MGNANQNYNKDDRGKGGGLWADGSKFSVHDCNFSFNSSYQGGAGVYSLIPMFPLLIVHFILIQPARQVRELQFILRIRMFLSCGRTLL